VSLPRSEILEVRGKFFWDLSKTTEGGYHYLGIAVPGTDEKAVKPVPPSINQSGTSPARETLFNTAMARAKHSHLVNPHLPSMVKPKPLRPHPDHSPPIQQDDRDSHSVEHDLSVDPILPLDEPEAIDPDGLCGDADKQEICQL
jgi:hypothetical protein